MSERLEPDQFERLLRRVASMFARTSWAADALMSSEKGKAVSAMVYRDWKLIPYARLDDAITHFVRSGDRTPSAAEIYQFAAGADYAGDPSSREAREQYCAVRGHTPGLDLDTFFDDARSESAGSPRGYVRPTCPVCLNAPAVTAEHAWEKWQLAELAKFGYPGWPASLPADCRSDYENQETML